MSTTRLDSGSDEHRGTSSIWFLAIVGHRDSSLVGRRAPVTAGEPLTLGREQSEFGAAVFDDDRISRHHARVEVAGDRLEISDLGSRNGTLVNEAKIDRAKLMHGDVVRLGKVVLVACHAPELFELSDDSQFVGISYPHHQMMRRLAELAPRPNTVVIEGETGTGKRLVAESLHRASGRTGAFVTIYCGAMADASLANELLGHRKGAFATADEDRVGLVEAADGGTLLLDGVDGASAELQALLLQFLESGSVRRIGDSAATDVDVRVLATAQRPLASLVDDGTLRRDFADRLGKLTLDVPPLRARRVDIGPLSAMFVERFAGEALPLHYRLSAALAMHDWPGNIRELEGLIELAVIDGAGESPVRLTQRLASLLSVEPVDALDKPNLEPTPAGVLVVAEDGTWFEPPGKKPVDLSPRPNLARLLAALARKRRDEPDTALSVDELLKVGWPGERVIERAGANRVYVALTTLRKLGLRDLISRSRKGYQIPPEIRLVVRA